MRLASARRIGQLAGLLFGLSFIAGSAVAGLGLGEARVQSYLGQPLDVRIALLQPSAAALESLSVEVASTEDHDRLGVPSEALALGLSVELDRSVDPPVIRLRSSRAVNDPFVQILINARWASGRMLREYTLFMDPPTVPIVAPIRRQDESAVRAEPVPAPQSESPVAPVTPEVAELQPEPRPERPQPVQAEVLGPIQSGQTLWSLASEWRPDNSLSMNQVMLAILEANPQAFTDNNVNFLQRGALLTMPAIADVRAIVPTEAARRIGQQNEAWELARRGRAVATVIDEAGPGPDLESELRAESEARPAPDPVAVGDVAVQEATVETALELNAIPRLELTPADEDILADIAAVGAERERLEAELGLLENEIRAESLESDEIAATLEQIRQAIESADAGGLMVANEDLAMLEQQLREARRQREAAPQAAAVEAIEPAPVAPAPEDAGSARWLWPAVTALVVIVLLLVILRIMAGRRRQAVLAETRIVESERTGRTTSPAAMPATDAAADTRLAELRRLAEEMNPEAFASAFESLRLEIEDPSDPRWREALLLARSVIPGRPQLDDEPHTDAADAAKTDADKTEADTRALMGILDSAADHADLDELDSQDFAFGQDEPRTPDEAGADEDLKLSKPDERFGADAPHADGEDRLAIADPEPTVSAREPDPATRHPEDRDIEALSLEFEFSRAMEETEDPDSAVGDLPGDETPAPAVPVSGTDAQPVNVSEDEWLWMNDEQLAATPVDPDTIGEDEPGLATLSDDDAEVKMDLARAYLSMDDSDSARALLEEILADGSEFYREQAERLLSDLE